MYEWQCAWVSYVCMYVYAIYVYICSQVFEWKIRKRRKGSVGKNGSNQLNFIYIFSNFFLTRHTKPRHTPLNNARSRSYIRVHAFILVLVQTLDTTCQTRPFHSRSSLVLSFRLVSNRLNCCVRFGFVESFFFFYLNFSLMNSILAPYRAVSFLLFSFRSFCFYCPLRAFSMPIVLFSIWKVFAHFSSSAFGCGNRFSFEISIRLFMLGIGGGGWAWAKSLSKRYNFGLRSLIKSIVVCFR